MFCDWDGLDLNPHTYASCITGMTSLHHHTQFVWWEEGLANFLPRLALNLHPTDLYLLSS
jgi:hypothetical protein